MQDKFKPALEQARKELATAIVERSTIENRILILKATVEGLSALCESEEAGEEDVVQVGGGLPPDGYITSLTDAIRRVVSDAGCVLTPPQIRNGLLQMRLKLQKYKQPLVPIHNTLKRLESQGEVLAVKDENGEMRGYRWVPPVARAMAELNSSRRNFGRRRAETPKG